MPLIIFKSHGLDIDSDGLEASGFCTHLQTPNAASLFSYKSLKVAGACTAPQVAKPSIPKIILQGVAIASSGELKPNRKV